MAFPSGTGSKRDDAQSAWLGARAFAADVKTAAQNVRTLSANGTLSATNLLGFVTYLADARAQFQLYGTVQGLQAYARAQLNDQTLDLGAAFTDMVTQIEAAGTWVVQNFPKDANGFLLAQTFGPQGRQVDRVLTAAQTAGLRTVLDALIATID